MSKALGYIAYEGPSLIDGKPIVVIINKLDGSDNAKTGAIVQSFIIRSDVAPTDALKTGADVSICGQCPHRPILARDNGQAPCYVNVGRSVRSVYKHTGAAAIPKPTRPQSRAPWPVRLSGLVPMGTRLRRLSECGRKSPATRPADAGIRTNGRAPILTRRHGRP